MLPFFSGWQAEYTLVIDYRGIINDEMRGFYRTRDPSNPSQFHACTQFEAIDARRGRNFARTFTPVTAFIPFECHFTTFRV